MLFPAGLSLFFVFMCAGELLAFPIANTGYLSAIYWGCLGLETTPDSLSEGASLVCSKRGTPIANRARAILCVCVYVCERVSVRERQCECLCECAREGEGVRERVRVCVCVREQCVCV